LTAPPCSTVHLHKIFNLKFFVMKTVEESTSKMIENQYSFKFKIVSNQEASLKAWEEENEEYASWNLILDKKDSATC